MQGDRLPRVLRVITRTNVGGPALHVSLLTAKLGDDIDTMLVAGRIGSHEAEATAVLQEHGVMPFRIPHLVRPVAPADDVRAYRFLRETIRKWQPDIVHTHTAKAGALARAAAVREGVPRIVHTFHGHVFRGHLGRFAAQVAVRVERRLARRTHAIVAVSAETADDIVDTYRIAARDRVHVIPLGVPDIRIDVGAARARVRRALGIPPEAPVALLAGRLVSVKQPQLALAAFDRVRAELPAARLLVAGGGDLLGTVRHSAHDRVHVLGWRDDVPDLLAAADAVVLSSAMEGSPVALIEAALLGRPAAATDVGGVRSVVEHGVTGLLAAPGDAQALGNAILTLLSDAATRERLGNAARSRARGRFGVERMVVAHRALYADLLAR